MTTLVRYDGEIVATVGRTRFYLIPAVEVLPDGDEKLRTIVLMCAFALEVAQKTVAGPYTDDDALRYARAALD